MIEAEIKFNYKNQNELVNIDVSFANFKDKKILELMNEIVSH